SGKGLRQIRGADSRKLVRFAPDGSALLVASSYDGGLALWSAETGQKIRDLGSATEDGRGIIQAAFLANGKTILTVEHAAAMVQEHPEIPQLPPTRTTVTELRLWDSETGRRLRSSRLNVPEHRVKFHAISPDG